MVTKQNLVKTILEATGANVYYMFPACWTGATAISWRESENRCVRRVDGAEYLSELAYIIDVWAEAPADVATLAANVDTRMRAAGFQRGASADLFESASHYYHRNLRYHCVVNPQGNIYQ